MLLWEGVRKAYLLRQFHGLELGEPSHGLAAKVAKQSRDEARPLGGELERRDLRVGHRRRLQQARLRRSHGQRRVIVRALGLLLQLAYRQLTLCVLGDAESLEARCYEHKLCYLLCMQREDDRPLNGDRLPLPPLDIIPEELLHAAARGGG